MYIYKRFIVLFPQHGGRRGLRLPPLTASVPGRDKGGGATRRVAGHGPGEAGGAAARPSAPALVTKRTPHKTPHFPRSADCGPHGPNRRFRHLRIAAAPGRGCGATCGPGRRESPAPSARRPAAPIPWPRAGGGSGRRQTFPQGTPRSGGSRHPRPRCGRSGSAAWGGSGPGGRAEGEGSPGSAPPRGDSF